MLAYRTGDGMFSQTARLTWYDRSGKATGTTGPVGDWRNPALSPDGKRFVADRLSSPGRSDVWLIDERGIDQRLTFAGR